MNSEIIIPNWIKYRYGVEDIFCGGMGVVFIISGIRLNCRFGLKTFQHKYWRAIASAVRFGSETILLTNLGKHPNIVQVPWVEIHNGQPFIFLENVPFGNLTILINRGGFLNIICAIRFAINFCWEMNHAEKIVPNFVHRDIRSFNCLIGGDVLKIRDFGLAKSIPCKFDIEGSKYGSNSEHSSMFQTNMNDRVCGITPYMAPELSVNPNSESIRSDIYSFGMVLFEMFTGELFFNCEDVKQLFETNIRIQLKDLRSERKNAPREISDIVFRCLSENPDDRFINFLEIETLLQNIYSSITGNKLDSGKEYRIGPYDTPRSKRKKGKLFSLFLKKLRK